MGMGIVKKHNQLLLYIPLLFSQYTAAADLIFKPSLKLEETYSDNVSLSRENNNPTSSLVTMTSAVIQSEYLAKRVNFNFNSESIYALYSHDHDLDNDYHVLDTNLSFQLWPDGIWFTSSAEIQNRASNQYQNSLADLVSTGTTQVATYSGGLQYNISNKSFSINSNIVYVLEDTEDNIGEKEGYSAVVKSTNGSDSNFVFWDIDNTYREISNNGNSGVIYHGEIKLGLITNYNINPYIRYFDEDNKGTIGQNKAFESNSYGLGFRWLATPKLQLELSYNKPIGNKLNSNNELPKNYVSASIDWQPTSRTKLQANISERFYGDSYGLSFTHKNKRFTNELNYVEEVQTLTRNNYSLFNVGMYWCPNSDEILFSNCFISGNDDLNFEDYQLITLSDFEVIEDNQFSLNKNLSWRSTLAYSRTTFTLGLSANNRQNLSTEFEDERSSISFSIKRKVSGKSNINLLVKYDKNIFQQNSDMERKNNYRQYELIYERNINQALVFNLRLGLLNRSSNDIFLNYKESRVTFKMTKDF